MKFINITYEEFKEINDGKEVVILDVRAPVELMQGVIPGAINHNLMDPDFLDEIHRLDKDKTYLVYCRSGSRSGQACQLMAGNGFKKLYNLIGGIGQWPYKIEKLVASN